MTQPPRFVHLRLHTEYSLVDGIVRVKPLMKTLAKMDMPAVALTDQCNLFAMVKFYRAATGAGIKPIMGVDAWVADADAQARPNRMLLLCRNQQGYQNLTRLISKSYLEGQHRGVPVMQPEWIAENADGLIALSGGREGDVGKALLGGRRKDAGRLLKHWKKVFHDDYYLELQRTGRNYEEPYIAEAVKLAGKTGTPVVATNDVHFLKADEFDAHEVRVCIHDSRTLDDPRRSHNYSPQQYLRSAEEMAALFEDLPEAIENSVAIARRCTLEVELGKSYLPQFPIPEGETTESYFARVSREGLEQRLEVLLDPQAEDYAKKRKEYEDRLQIEIDVITSMGFPGYFLIVADFIRWSREHGIPVGPGRGSGAGSLVAYALKITDLDPLQFDLLFERFLNPERVSLPDFDVDFCMDRRDEVIDYVARTYGRESVSQIITYGTMAAKAVVRDVGRVMGQPYGFVDRIAKMIPFEIGMTLEKALTESEDLKKAYDEEEEVTTIIDMARTLEGLARNAGKHAGGVVIAPGGLTEFTPLYCEEGGSSIVTQFDKDDVEAVGLVKFDFLGLRTLTIIDWAVKHINRRRELGRDPAGSEPLDITQIALEDEVTFKLLQDSNTSAVFQLESRGMKDLIKRLRPDTFEDIVALVALFRPGPLQSGMVDDFINRKHGRAKVDYPHPDLEPILKPTYGVILYQEQVMQIAQVLAGYTLGGADMLRRAMGKKKAEVMAEQREIFMQGATERGVDADQATYIFDLMEKFAGYGFNKCVHGDTRIMDADSGQWRRVEDLFKSGARPRVHACDDDFKLVPRQVEDVVWNGVKPVYRLRTTSGREIRATGNHPFRTKAGWTHLEELSVGDRIAQARLVESADDPSQLGTLENTDVAWTEIESIEYEGDFDTYDLQVAEHHNFVAEGLVVHNSHSAAYALLSYHTAWLKHHYPAEFMAAVLSADMDNTDKVVALIEDCHKQDLSVSPPHVNHSVYQFSVHDEKTVRYGLGAIKGVGGAALDGIIEEREADGPYADLYDFCKRNDTRKVNRRVMEALIKAGALDALGKNRASLLASLASAVQMAEKSQADAIAGQDDMFGSSDVADPQESVHVVEVEDWEDELRLFNEKETLGLYLTGHPIDRYEDELAKFTDCRLEKIAEMAPPENTGEGGYRRQKGKDYRLAGLMVGMRVRKTARGKMITAVLDDRTARIEVTVFNEVHEQYGHLLQKDKLVIVEGTVSWDDFNGAWNMRAKTVYDITQAREVFSRCLEIDVDRMRMNGEWSEVKMTRELTTVLQTYREGRLPVCVQYSNGAEITRLALGDEWRVSPTDELLGRLEKLVGDGGVGVVY